MGIARIKFLHDLRRLGANLRLECPKCGRVAVYPREEMISYFHARRWNEAWEVLGSYFRCRECDHKGTEPGIAPWESNVARPTPPMPISEHQAKEQWRRNRG